MAGIILHDINVNDNTFVEHLDSALDHHRYQDVVTILYNGWTGGYYITDDKTPLPDKFLFTGVYFSMQARAIIRDRISTDLFREDDMHVIKNARLLKKADQCHGWVELSMDDVRPVNGCDVNCLVHSIVP